MKGIRVWLIPSMFYVTHFMLRENCITGGSKFAKLP